MSPPSWTRVVLNLDTVADAEKSAVALQAKLQEIDKLTNAAPAEVAANSTRAPTSRSCASAAATTATSSSA